MNTFEIARKDFHEAIRSRLLWVLTVLFVVVMAVSVYLPEMVFDGTVDPAQALSFMDGPGTVLLIPVVAIVLGYGSIVGERETGSIRFLLGLPNSRREILRGKFLGRTAVLTVPLLLGFLAGGVVTVAVYGVPPLSIYLPFVLLALLLGAAFVAFAVGVSASSSTQTRAISVVLLVFLLTQSLWNFLVSGLHYAFRGTMPGGELPNRYELVSRLNPIEAYSAVGDRFFAETERIVLGGGGASTQSSAATEQVADVLYLEWWTGIVVLVLWIGIPLGFGYLRFRAADLS